MARGKKNEKELTIEEWLEQALVPAEEQPYSVPENWCWTRWGNCGDFIAGSGFKNEFQGFTEYTIPFYKVGSLKYSDSAGYLFDNTNTVNDEMRTALKATLIPEDSVLFAKIGEAIKLNRRSLNRVPCCIDNNMMAFVPDSYVFNFYAFFWSKGIELYDYTNATTVPAIRKSDLENIPFPLPPLAEQHRIVDRIESLFAKLDEAKEKAQAVVDGFESRKAAILHKAFTGELTAKWRYNTGKEQTDWEEAPLDCYLEPMETKRPEGDFFSYIDIDSIDNRIQRVRSPKIMPSVMAPSRASRAVKSGSVLFSMVRPYLKNIALIGNELSDCIASTGFYVCNCKKTLLPKFLFELLRSDDCINYLMQFMKGDNSPSIRKNDLLNMIVRIPSMEEQIEIVRILDNLLAKEQQAKETAEAVLDQIEAMKKSILARAFRGELGTNDPTEESAVELLKRV